MNVTTQPEVMTARTPRMPLFGCHLKDLGHRTESEGGFELTNEMQKILGETEKKLNIPHSTNRFQGKYEEIVPQQYKARKGLLNKEKKEQEAKKEVIKQRVLKAKSESEKIREINMLRSQKYKCMDLPLQMKSPKKKMADIKAGTTKLKLKHPLSVKAKKNLEQDKGIPESKTERWKDGVWTNEQIKKLIKENELLKEQNKPVQTAEERKRRKCLVDIQKEKFRAEEERKKQSLDELLKQRTSRIMQIKDEQKIIREWHLKRTSKNKKRKSAKSKKVNKLIKKKKVRVKIKIKRNQALLA